MDRSNADDGTMFATLIAKVAVTAILGFSAGFYGVAVATLDSTPAVTVNAGAFGGPVTHVGSIEWDVEQPTAARLRPVRCAAGAAAGTSCFVGR